MRNRTVIEDMIKERKKITERDFDKVKNLHHLNPDGDHIASIYIRNNKSIDISILKLMLKNIKHKKFKNYDKHPLVVAVNLERIELYFYIIEEIDLFSRDCSGTFLFSKIVDKIDRVIAEKIIDKFTDVYDKSKYQTKFFDFIFKHEKLFTINTVKYFINILVNEKTEIKSKIYKVYDFFASKFNLVFYNQNREINYSGPSDLFPLYQRFLLNNKNLLFKQESPITKFLGFSFQDKVLDKYFNNTKYCEELISKLNIYKINMIDLILDSKRSFGENFSSAIEKINIIDKTTDQNIKIHCATLFAYELILFAQV